MDEGTIVPILSNFRHFSMLLQFILNVICIYFVSEMYTYYCNGRIIFEHSTLLLGKIDCHSDNCVKYRNANEKKNRNLT
jgi:hypothetical protein